MMTAFSHANQADETLSMRVPFRSAWELKTLFAQLGLDFRIVQITAGELFGSFELGGHPDTPVFSIRTNQGLLFEGDRRPNATPIALENTNSLDLHRVRGEVVGQHCIHGFNRFVTESFFQISPGAYSSFALLNSDRLVKLLVEAGDDQLFETMESANSVAVNHELFQRMQSLIQCNPSTDAALHQDLLLTAVLECLHPEQTTVLHDGELTQGAGLMKELLTWGHSNPTKVIKLEDLTRYIFASRSAIVQNCRVMYGMGPMALLKQIRLGQVQHALSQPLVQRQIGCTNVQSIASYYGFTSRNHFARDYRQQFGEAPSQTLQANAVPGMVSQPVSVAQMPQIAIARR